MWILCGERKAFVSGPETISSLGRDKTDKHITAQRKKKLAFIADGGGATFSREFLSYLFRLWRPT